MHGRALGLVFEDGVDGESGGDCSLDGALVGDFFEAFALGVVEVADECEGDIDVLWVASPVGP